MYWVEQGDVCIFPVSKIPAGLEKTSDGVLQHGEATGHAHRLHGGGFTIFEDKKENRKYLRLVRPTMLKHEEHKEIELPAGDYVVGIVKEYDHFKEEARRVVD